MTNKAGSTLLAAFVIIGIIVILSFFSWAFSVTPRAGQEAVLTDYPLLFGSGGVRNEPVRAGRAFVWPTSRYTIVDMRPMQFSESFDDLMSSDGVPLDFDAIIRTQTTDSVILISKFGEEWYANNVRTEFRNRVRQAVRKHGMNETAIETTAIDNIDKEVTSAMETYLASSGLPIRLIQVTVGKANPPDSVKDQRIATAQQQQRRKTEDERKLAEDNRLAAEQSRAAADNAYQKAMGLSPEQFLGLEAIRMQATVCKEAQCTFIVNGSQSGVVPVIQATK